jgi:hypothetical protein
MQRVTGSGEGRDGHTAIFEGGTSQHGCCDGANPFNVALSVES